MTSITSTSSVGSSEVLEQTQQPVAQQPQLPKEVVAKRCTIMGIFKAAVLGTLLVAGGGLAAVYLNERSIQPVAGNGFSKDYSLPYYLYDPVNPLLKPRSQFDIELEFRKDHCKPGDNNGFYTNLTDKFLKQILASKSRFDGLYDQWKNSLEKVVLPKPTPRAPFVLTTEVAVNSSNTCEKV